MPLDDDEESDQGPAWSSRQPWFIRSIEPTSIRSIGAIEYVACRERESGDRRVIVAARADAPRGPVTALLAEIARVHRLLDHPHIPRVAGVHLDDAPPWIELVCDAVADFESLSMTVVDEKYLINHRGAAAYVLELCELLHTAHETRDPTTGRGIRLGAFSTGNVLVNERGDTWTLGWGQPWRGTDRASLLGRLPQSFIAVETSLGVAPLPGSDLAAGSLYFHSFRRLGDLPSELMACLAGAAAGPLNEVVTALVMNAHAARPEDRSIPRFLIDFRKVLDILGLAPDIEIFRRDLRAIVELWRRSLHAATFVVSRTGDWCLPPGAEPISLERRGSLRRLLLALCTARRDAPGRALPWEELLRAGWPDDKSGVEAAKNRVYVAISQLRTSGLRDVLVRRDTGYLLDPNIGLAMSDDPAPKT